MTYSIPGELETLNLVNDKYLFFVKSGQVVGDPSRDGSLVHFFLSTQDGQEIDVTLEAANNVRPGHDVTVIYVAKNGRDEGFPVGWINLTTGKHEVIKPAINDMAGGGLAIGLMKFITGILEAASHMLSGAGVLFSLFLLPLMLMVLMFAGAGLVVALLLSSKPFLNARKLKHHTELILADRAPEKVKQPAEPMTLKALGVRVAAGAFFLFVVFPLLF